MSYTGYVLIDGNNIGFAATATTTLKVGDVETQGVYGFLRQLLKLAHSFPHLRPVVLWDGRSWRHDYFKEYKANRNAEPKTKAERALKHISESFKQQRGMIVKALKALGVFQMRVANLEADDLAALLVRRYSAQETRVLLYSGDQDWIQLVSPSVSWFSPKTKLHITSKTIGQKLGFERKQADGTVQWVGVPSPRAWLEIKALMGDPSDNISGVGGIGERGAMDLIAEYGSVASFMARAIDGSITSMPKKFAALYDEEEKQATFQRNLMLMDLNAPIIPKPQSPIITPGQYDEEAFLQLCRDNLFTSFIKNIDDWRATFGAVPREEV